MSKLIDTPIDHKNIGLLKLLYELREDLDIFCLISVNADRINERGIGRRFFGRLDQLVIGSISLNICKIYEFERVKSEYELNSISGVFRHLLNESPTALDDSKIKSFVQKYDGPSDIETSIHALQSTIESFQDKYKDELKRIKTFRDKYVAHSEYGFNDYALPSYDVMEKLFLFGADYYELVSRSFVGVGPFDLMARRYVKSSIKRLLRELGIENIKTDM